MKGIGGNICAQLQELDASSKNSIGEVVPVYTTVKNLAGFLDYVSGEAKSATYDAKIQESTHIFICDWCELAPGVQADRCRMVINGEMYDVKLIDDPMQLHHHYEFYLAYTGR